MEEMEKSEVIRIMNERTNHSSEALLNMISQSVLVEAIWKSLIVCGVPYSPENHEILVKIISKRITGSADQEFDWSKKERDVFVKFDGFMKHKIGDFILCEYGGYIERCECCKNEFDEEKAFRLYWRERYSESIQRRVSEYFCIECAVKVWKNDRSDWPEFYDLDDEEFIGAVENAKSAIECKNEMRRRRFWYGKV